jgi:probable HAF family extracellular repeat protein
MAARMRLSAQITRIAGPMLGAVALWGCQETPTEPSPGLNPKRVAAGTFSAVNLGTLGGSFSAALGINPRGQVVGTSTTSGGDFRATLWTRKSEH